MQIEFRPTTADDLDYVVELKARSIREDLERHGRWHPDRSREWVARSFAPEWTRLIHLDGHLAGTVSLRRAPDALWLELFYLEPGLRGRGAGTAVLRRILADHGHERIRLDVLSGSRARTLYEREGFVLESVHEIDEILVREPTARGDGSAGDADYGAIGSGYTNYRQPEPRFLAAITDAFGDARTVINVGAGAGSYEPADREVTAVEPSAAMRAQRPGRLSSAIDASAEDLPFADDAFDAALASFTVHQWADLAGGLRELRRVTTGPVVVLTCDPATLTRFWLNEYAPEVIATEARRYPAPEVIADLLGGAVTVTEVPIPLDCTDGFSEAYYGRPEALLDPGARQANSAWSFVAPEVAERFVSALSADLASGAWDARHGHLRTRPEFRGSLVLIVAR
ncbi:bifunctional GNAT family N-acetyltransferase/class I SAM-dependent methyltransferase [Microbacterium gorillae]|uniref:bifunctional GNAT family N-acetyltransferase/class I SAM-dependent methyltransferase n=1 Tax=Microbacterium gorillae TaxID=1231063 RepID=UPI000A6BD225|nr:bifunctional GNAT family N-acetyltransferase/class I SAM-dependent methyltransferase [Microbacterium gorillae]